GSVWVQGIFRTDFEGGFCDIGNGIWDDDEWTEGSEILFYNIENDLIIDIDTLASNWDPNEPFFKRTTSLNNLIVDYQDIIQPAPIALEELNYGIIDTISGELVPTNIVIKAGYSTDTGKIYKHYALPPIITEYDVPAYYSKTYDIIDHYETTYSNVLIEQLDNELIAYCSDSAYTEQVDCQNANKQWIEPAMDYLIMKSRWVTDAGYDYNYHSFRQKSHGDIVQLTHPIYFKHYGYITQFWAEKSVKEVTILRTIMGSLREGDSTHVDSVVITPTGDYEISTDYVVSLDNIAVPYTIGYVDLQSGKVICNQNNAEVDNFFQCPQDSDNIIIKDCFKIQQTRTIKLFGPA
ncbi:hypothetical protein, partial [Candidatus Pelagibacter communis]|uniref:hypothetical protein n=1 Tax=Pelagibacter ubique TaxID=198252 RepID=UPI000A5D6965